MQGVDEPLQRAEKVGGNLVGGHQRLKILISQGVKEVEVSVVDLPLEKEKALNIALNKIQGRWDEDKLAQLLEELKLIPDFDVELSGFDFPEISQVLDNFHQPKDGDDFDFEACAESIREPITKEGDLIELGSHRILCGDSGNPEHIKLLLGDEKIHLLPFLILNKVQGKCTMTHIIPCRNRPIKF